MTLALNAQVTGRAQTGDEQRLPVILLHGLFGSLENLGGVARRLAELGPVHSLDLRNHGRSPHAESMAYKDLAADVLAYLDRENLAKVALLGHSMGGKTAMQLALDAPERVGRLIVADIAPVAYPPHHDDILAGLRAVDPARLKSRAEADQALKAHIDTAAVRQFLLKNLVKREAGGFAWRLNLDAIESHYGQIVAPLDASQPYAGPVLFIKGGASDYIQESHRPAVARLFPAAILRTIPGTGHWLHAEKTDLFATLCERFLAGEMD